MNKKTYGAPLRVKSSGSGEVVAVFATLNLPDKDQDVTLPGAFSGAGPVIIERWNHSVSSPPVGMGTIHESGNDAILEGRFFLETDAGREHYEIVKALGAACEWSYSFRVRDSEPGIFQGQRVRFLKSLEVAGVGPVTRGAGLTRTVAVKALRDGWNAARVQAELDLLRLDLTLSGGDRGRDRELQKALDLLHDQALDAGVVALRAELKALPNAARPTNMDRVREAILATYGRDGASENWIQRMVEIDAEARISELCQRHAYTSRDQARAEVMAWLNTPVF